MLRWLIKADGTRVLEDLYRGNDGSEKWVQLPEVREEMPEKANCSHRWGELTIPEHIKERVGSRFLCCVCGEVRKNLSRPAPEGSNSDSEPEQSSGDALDGEEFRRVMEDYYAALRSRPEFFREVQRWLRANFRVTKGAE